MRIRSKLVLAGMLAASALLLAACGGSGSSLIPESNAIPLRSDFQAVAEAAREGNGECAATERAIAGMERDFRALPATVDRGLHSKLEEGVKNLSSQSLRACKRQTSTTSSTTSSSTTTSSTTTSSSTTSSTTTTTTTSSTTSEPTTSATYTYTETSTPPVTPSETGGTEASSSAGAEGGEEPEEPEDSEGLGAPGGAAAGGVP